MKKLFLLLPFTMTAQQQAVTNLTINLSEVYSITVDNNATINLTSKNDYLNGSQSENNLLNVFATNGYRLSMQTTNENFVNNVDLHFSNIITLPLSNTLTEIYQSNVGTLSDDFNLYYRIEDTEPFLNQSTNTLTTIITYTITPL